MPVKFEPEFIEEWVVQVGKEVFSLTGKQVKLLKNATVNGQRGVIWFDKFAISIPHIQSVWRISRRPSKHLQAPSEPDITEAQRRENKKKLVEIKNNLFTKKQRK